MLYSKIAESDIGEVNRNPKQGRLSLTVLRFTQQNEWNPWQSVSEKAWPARQWYFA